MNQVKSKVKDLENQPSIAKFVNPPKTQRSVNHRSRSNSVKRKKHPSPQDQDLISEKKKLIRDTGVLGREKINFEMLEPDELKRQTEAKRDGTDELTNLDTNIVKALEILLQPIREDINSLRSEVQVEFKESARLREENL